MEKQMKENFIKLSDLEEFLNLHPITLNELTSPSHKHIGNINVTSLFIKALTAYLGTKQDIIKELAQINESLSYYSSSDYFISHKSRMADFMIEEVINSLEFLKSYDGYWLNSLLKGLDYDAIDSTIYELKSKTSYQFEYNNNSEEHEKFIADYYKRERKISDEDLFAAATKCRKTFASFKFKKDSVDVSKIKYPILVAFIKDDKIKSLKKCSQKLDSLLTLTEKTLDYDEYSYIYVPENSIYEVATEFFIRNKVANINTSIINTNCIYKSIKQVKRRYKYAPKVDWRIVKKVIDLYDIPQYNLDNGYQLIDKDKFDRCLNEYLESKNVKGLSRK